MKVFKEKLLPMLPYAIFLLVGGFLLIRPIMDGDEIWNYNFARNICEGRMPYVDFNMLQTPLSAYLAAFFLKFFGNSLFHFRVVAILLLTVLFSSLYWFCKKLVQSKMVAFVITGFLYGLNYVLWNYNYNNINLLLLLWIMCLEWKRMTDGQEKETTYYEIIIGILVGLTPLVKQSTGAVLLIINIIMCAGGILCRRNKWKQKVIRATISIMPLVVFGVSLVSKNTFVEFCDYAIRGVAEFSHKRTYFDYIFSTPFAFLIGVFPLVAIFVCIKKFRKNRELRTVIGCLLFWAVGGFVVAYPLCDTVHMVVAIVPFVPCILLGYQEQKLKKYEKYICGFLAFLVMLAAVYGILPSREGYKKCELAYFKGLPIEIALETHILEVTDYITKQNDMGKKVVVADEYGALYSIPLNQCNKNFDMLLIGNIGTNDTTKLLNMYWGDILLVRRKEETLGYQADVELITEVKRSYEKIDEVSSFDAYIRKEEQ